MPAPETSDLIDRALLWTARHVDAYGNPRVDTPPEEVDVRWNQRRTMGADASGNPVALDAMVAVDQEIPVGSVMWLGSLADWLGTGSGGPEDELHEVMTYNESWDLRGRECRRELGLRRKGDALPQLS